MRVSWVQDVSLVLLPNPALTLLHPNPNPNPNVSAG